MRVFREAHMAIQIRFASFAGVRLRVRLRFRSRRSVNRLVVDIRGCFEVTVAIRQL
jgi:hypothetical protein